MNENHSHQFDELTGNLRLAVEQIRQEPVPPEAMQRAIDRAGAISRQGKAKMPVLRRTLFAAAGIAAMVVVGVGVWMFWPTDTWADVAKAVQGKPWLRMSSKEPDGTDYERWFSPSHQISATRYGKHVEYQDHRLQIYYTYDPEEGVLYRVPTVPDARQKAFTALHNTVQGLLTADGSDSPLAAMSLLGRKLANVKILSEKKRVVKDEAGQTWSEFNLTVQHEKIEEPVQMLVRVDPRTKLPKSWKMQGKMGDREIVREVFFEYPEKGPSDAYALGVPRTAKFVDRVPKGDLARIIEGVKAGRQRFDNYHAIVVEGWSGSEPPHWHLGKPHLVWRKGNRWRVEFSHPQPLVPHGKALGPDVDIATWWKNRAKQYRYFLMAVCDGQKYWNVHGKANPLIGPADDPSPSYSTPFMPEYLSHPFMGIPQEHLDAEVETDLKGWLPEIVLVRVRMVGKRVREQIKSAGLRPPDAYRYWIDTSRGFMALRWQMVGGQENGKEEYMSDYVLEKFDRSPQGHWYPTVARRKNSSTSLVDGTKSDRIYWFVLDFNADIPDSLFRPVKRTTGDYPTTEPPGR